MPLLDDLSWMSGVVTAAKKYKYGPRLVAIGNCPPSGCTAKTLTAYRFIYDPDPANESYLPQAIKQPQRVWNGADAECCGMGLSMFTTEGAARQLFANLRSKYKNKVFAILGTHLAQLMLNASHGLCEKADSRGHFNLFEYVGVDLTAVRGNVQQM